MNEAKMFGAQGTPEQIKKAEEENLAEEQMKNSEKREVQEIKTRIRAAINDQITEMTEKIDTAIKRRFSDKLDLKILGDNIRTEIYKQLEIMYCEMLSVDEYFNTHSSEARRGSVTMATLLGIMPEPEEKKL